VAETGKEIYFNRRFKESKVTLSGVNTIGTECFVLHAPVSVTARRNFRGPEILNLSRLVRPRLITLSTDCQCFSTVDSFIDGLYAVNALIEKSKMRTAGVQPVDK
jgi:hypothetical protein